MQSFSGEHTNMFGCSWRRNSESFPVILMIWRVTWELFINLGSWQFWGCFLVLNYCWWNCRQLFKLFFDKVWRLEQIPWLIKMHYFCTFNMTCVSLFGCIIKITNMSHGFTGNPAQYLSGNMYIFIYFRN